MKTDTKTALSFLNDIQRKISALNHAGGVLYYDGATVAPTASASGRGMTLSYLSELAYGLATSDETCKAIDHLLSHSDELDETQLRNVKLFNKEREYMQSIPVEKYTAFTKLCSESSAVWHDAKLGNDYASFAPYLKRLLETQIEFAGYYKPDKAPYDVMLDSHEEGLDTSRADKFFQVIKNEVVPLIAEIQRQPEIDSSFLEGTFDVDKQRVLTDFIMRFEKLDPKRCICGETEHPFTTNFTTNDVRITTHYYPENFTFSMYSVAHEGGHALYELGVNPEYNGTSLAGGVSMGIHECQSRFFENIICRSKAFCDYAFPTVSALFADKFSFVTPDMFYRAINKSEPSLIRTEADELTYPLHILIRYEIEKMMFDGKVSVDDLPELWNAKYKEYLGVDVPDDTHGILQDMHWSDGSFGYFPSYALGSAYGAQILDTMTKSIDVYVAVGRGDITPVSDWLHEHIWQYGCARTPERLLKDCVGAEFDPHFYTNYLKNKFRAVYGI